VPPPRVLVLSFTDHATDPRVNRQIRFLSETYSVTSAGTGPPGVPGVEHVPLPMRRKPRWLQALAVARLLLRRYDAYYWARADVRATLAALPRAGADLIVANDLEALPVALRLAGGGNGRPPAEVLFDAHEYAPLEFEDLLWFRLFQQRYREHLCRAYIPRAAAMTTVCDSIAERYSGETGAPCEVVWNAPDYEDLAPQPPMRDGLLRLAHHGAALPSRRLETMIRGVVAAGAHVRLDFYLTAANGAYLDELRREARGDARIRFLPPVPMRSLPCTLNGYDAGVFLLEPTNYNYRVALPNKFFEFVQARIATVIGPSPEMARLLTMYDLGVITPDFTAGALAASLAALTPERIAHFKARAHAASRTLSADTSRARLLAIAERLLGGGR
jgi:hypothetical protein